MPLLKTQLTLEDLQKRVEKLEQQNNPSKEVTPEAKFKVGEFSEAYLKGLLNQTEQLKEEVTKETKFKVGDWIKFKTGTNNKKFQIKEIEGNNVFIDTLGYYPYTFFEIEYEKPQTKYRKNGALVFAPKEKINYWSIDSDGRIEQGQWLPDFPYNEFKFQQGLVFDNQQACQLWADKFKMAYALKQRIVEAESKNEDLEYCYISFYLPENKKEYSFEQIFPMITPSVLTVSTNAKDILMSDEVSDEEFKAFIEVFSL